MINKFITVPHSADTLKTLELRATQLVTGFHNDSIDEDLKSRIHEHYSGPIDNSPSLTTDKAALDQIFEYLRSDQLISKAPLETFLCFSSDQNLLARFQALILIVSLEHRRLFRLGNERLISVGRTKSALDAFRRLLQDKDKNKNAQEIFFIERELPNPLQDLKQVAQQLDSFLARLPKTKKKYIQRRLQPIYRVLDDVAEGKLRNVRDREKQGDVATGNHEQETEQNPEEAAAHGVAVKKGSYSAVTRAAKVDDEEAAHAEIREYPNTTHNTFNDAEFFSDNAPVRSYITLAPDPSTPASLKRSFALSAVHAKTVANHIERNEKRLITSMNQLTRHDIDCLKEALQQKAETQPIVVFVVHLMLATGRRLEQILRARKIEHVRDMKQSCDAIILQENGDMYWVYRPDLPMHTLKGDLELFIDRQTSPVILPLPFSPAMDWARYLPANTEALRQAIIDFINDVNCDYKTKLTSNRIGDFLSNYLHHQGVDDVVNALITGNPDIQEAGTYYHQFDHTEILNAYELFTKEFFSNAIPDDIKTPLINRDGGGSQLIVKHQAVSALFAHLAAKVHFSKGIAEFHNAYTYYILHLLNLTTGHRPVRDPFDDLSHIDLLNKKIFISDKESRQTASSARVLVLPRVAIQQIKLYLEHLESIQLLLHSIDPQLADAVEMTLSGTNRLLFLLGEDELGGYQIQSLAPKDTKEYLGALFDIPTNWHRHFLRTSLAQHDVPGELIDSWMGHAKIGQEGYSRYSGLSMQGLENTAVIIDQIMEVLEIKPLPGRGGIANE